MTRAIGKRATYPNRETCAHAEARRKCPVKGLNLGT